MTDHKNITDRAEQILNNPANRETFGRIVGNNDALTAGASAAWKNGTQLRVSRVFTDTDGDKIRDDCCPLGVIDLEATKRLHSVACAGSYDYFARFSARCAVELSDKDQETLREVIGAIISVADRGPLVPGYKNADVIKAFFEGAKINQESVDEFMQSIGVSVVEVPRSVEVKV